MSGSMAGITEKEIDRLRELAHIGASWAAGAFARLVERTILTRVPMVATSAGASGRPASCAISPATCRRWWA
jgi:hypothetical protein